MKIPNVSAEIKEYLSGAYAQSMQWKLPNGANSNSSKAVTIKNVGVIGGGTMGRGIAVALCLAGYDVVLIEMNEQALKACQYETDVTIKREVALKRFGDEEVSRLKSGALRFSITLNDLADSDLVIEAVFEDMKLKKNLFERLDQIVKNDAIFGSNTSSLNIDEMASVLRHPPRLVGIHFFNPPHVIRMVEIVHGKYTSGSAVATAFAACKAMKKLPVLVGNCPSFVFNRLLAVYLNQTHRLMYDYGLLPKDIDAIVLSAGFLMGPVTMHDMNGIDVGAKVKKENNVPLNILEERLLKENRLGRKNGKGFYFYDEKTRAKQSDPWVDLLVKDLSRNGIRHQILFSDSDVLDFLLFPMVNEGFLCLEEGMISSEALIDIMFILGFGWPPQTGGPMKWGRTKGLRRVMDYVRKMQKAEPEDRTYKLSEALVNNARDASKL